MKQSITAILIASCLTTAVLVGCGSESGGANRPVSGAPVQGTLGLDNLTPEQQIEKVQNDKSIPEQYKQTYINSIKAKATAGGAPK